MSKIKIHMPWPWTFEPNGETLQYMIAARKHGGIELCSFEDADFLLYTQDTRLGPYVYSRAAPGTIVQNEAYKILSNINLNKEIVIDCADWSSEQRMSYDSLHSRHFYENVFLYFKRSMVNKETNTIVDYSREILQIPYAIRNDYVEYAADLKPMDKKYDFCCLFPILPTDETVAATRISIPHSLSSFKTKEYSRHIGFVQGNPYEVDIDMSVIYATVQPDYFDVLRQSKIIINCNPPDWEGDQRLTEALLTGNLVFSDRIIANHLYDNPWIDKKHLVFYDDLPHLHELLEYYLGHEDERIAIGQAGKEFLLSYHTYTNRLDTILNKIRSNS
jgi:hypothetical protein